MRSKDRLDELRQVAGPAEGGVSAPGPPLPRDIADLLQEVEAISRWIDEVRGDSQLIRRLHSDPTYHANKHVQDQLDAAVTRAHAAGLKLCGALRQLAGRAAEAAGAAGAEGAPGAAGAAGRMARLQYACSRRRCAAALAEHAQLLQLLRDDRARLLHEQIKLTNLTLSEEECEQLLDSNNVALFVDNVRAQTAEARRALRDAEARRGELARAEAALREVRDLFVQLSHLVAQQCNILARTNRQCGVLRAASQRARGERRTGITAGLRGPTARAQEENRSYNLLGVRLPHSAICARIHVA